MSAADSSERGDDREPAALGAAELAERIASGALTSEAAVDAHLARIEAVNARLNAMVVLRADEARAEARAADRLRAEGRPLGPLHGVPITIKESFDVAGTATTAGLTTRRDHRAQGDGPLVARLRAAGAIVLGKTNVAQLLFFVESSNPLYGRASNPWDPTRTTGGSSGGEAAIIAAGGSALGLGSDIGGSVRIPAHFCGVSALKPTGGRLPPLGSLGAAISRQEAIVDSAGLIARRVADLGLALSVVAAPGLDPTVPPVPLGDPAAVELRGLRVGWYTDDGYSEAAPALRRAVKEAAAALEARGATVVPWPFPEINEAIRLFAGLLSADGMAGMRRLLDRRGGCQTDPNIRLLTAIAPRRPPVRRLLSRIFSAAGQQRLGFGARIFGRRSVDEYWCLLEERALYRARFFAALDEARLDALLCPPMPGPAFPHGHNNRIGLSNHYCLPFNVLGLPAGVVAATRVRAGEESDRADSRDRGVRALGRAEVGSAGLPVGVQLAARPWREDVVLALMGALEAHFRAQPDYPARPPD